MTGEERDKTILRSLMQPTWSITRHFLSIPSHLAEESLRRLLSTRLRSPPHQSHVPRQALLGSPLEFVAFSVSLPVWLVSIPDTCADRSRENFVVSFSDGLLFPAGTLRLSAQCFASGYITPSQRPRSRCKSHFKKFEREKREYSVAEVV